MSKVPEDPGGTFLLLSQGSRDLFQIGYLLVDYNPQRAEEQLNFIHTTRNKDQIKLFLEVRRLSVAASSEYPERLILNDNRRDNYLHLNISPMSDDRTEGVVVHLMSKHDDGEIERKYDNWEIVDEGWIRCIGPSHGGELESGHVPVAYYPPERVVSVDVYEKPSRKSA